MTYEKTITIPTTFSLSQLILRAMTNNINAGVTLEPDRRLEGADFFRPKLIICPTDEFPIGAASRILKKTPPNSGGQQISPTRAIYFPDNTVSYQPPRS